jgi:hypothetical protein
MYFKQQGTNEPYGKEGGYSKMTVQSTIYFKTSKSVEQLVEIRPATQQKVINKIAQLTEWGCIVSSVISGPTTTSKERKLSKSEQELQSKVCEYPLD